MAAHQRRKLGALAIAPASRMLFTDLPLTVLVIAGICSTFSKYLEGEGCSLAASEAIDQHGGWDQLPVYVPEGFPCGTPTIHQATWLLGHPYTAFLLSANPMHRCWMFATALLTQLIWLLSCILVSAASPSGYGIRLRSAFYPLLRIAPKAIALTQLLAQGPIPTVIHIYTQSSQLLPVALLHIVTSIGGHYTGLLDLPIFLASSLFGWFISLTTRYLLSMHGHATWTVTHVATDTFTYLGVPLLFTVCVSGWEHRSRERRRRLHGGDSCGDMGGLDAVGQGGTGLGATVAEEKAAEKIEGQVASAPSSCSAGSPGETSHLEQQQQQQQQQEQNEQDLQQQMQQGVQPAAVSAAKVAGKAPLLCSAGLSGVASGADPLQQRGQSSDGKAPVGNSSGSAGMISSALVAAEGQEAVTAASFPSQASASVEGSFDGTGVTPARGGGIDTAALTGASLLAAAAAAVAVNNRARGGGHGGEAIPFDDPEKWPSVITVRQILAQPMAEWQPMFTRQRVSMKVGRSGAAAWEPIIDMHLSFTVENHPANTFGGLIPLCRSPGMNPSSSPPTGGLLCRKCGINPRQYRAPSSIFASGGEI